MEISENVEEIKVKQLKMSGGVREAATDEARNEAYTIFSDLSEVNDIMLKVLGSLVV